MNAAVKLVNPTDAGTFLRMLGDRHTFQTFDDIGKHRRDLPRILQGTLAEHAETLARLNARGAGVFVMVNAGDGKGRKTANVQTVRAVFVDLDGAPLEPVKASPLQPHCIVETSPGRWHAYWRISDCSLLDFTPLQKQLATRFNADAKVCDLPRVMRIPGFDHRKRQPFRSRIIEYNERAPYTLAELRAAFGFDTVPAIAPAAPAKPRRTLPDIIPEGERNDTLFSLARGLVQKGFDAPAVNARLQRLNAERCQPLLCATEVDTIAANASAYGSDGVTKLPHKLHDSPDWKALPPTAQAVILLWFRRYDGANSDNIALTEKDFAGCEGFGSNNTFRDALNAALASGILVRVSEAHNTQRGRKPALYAIAAKWIPKIRQVQKVHVAPSADSAHL